MLDKIVQESPFYRETMQKGEQIGLQRGELDALRATILRFVKKRFASLADAAEAQVKTMTDLAKLQTIVDEIPFVPDVAAARALLELPA